MAIVITLVHSLKQNLQLRLRDVINERLNTLSLFSSWLFTNDYIFPQKGWSLQRVLRMPIVAGWINENYATQHSAFDAARNRTLCSAAVWLHNKLPCQVISMVPARYPTLVDYGAKISDWILNKISLPFTFTRS